jgi:hypothetical protein
MHRLLIGMAMLVLGLAPARAQDFQDLDYRDAKVVFAAPEFTEAKPTAAKRRISTAWSPDNFNTPSTDMLVFTSQGYEALIFHNYTVQKGTWRPVDLEARAKLILAKMASTMSFGSRQLYERDGATGAFQTLWYGPTSLTRYCAAFVVEKHTDQLTGLVCNPAGKTLREEDARRFLGQVGIKGILPPG